MSNDNDNDNGNNDDSNRHDDTPILTSLPALEASSITDLEAIIKTILPNLETANDNIQSQSAIVETEERLFNQLEHAHDRAIDLHERNMDLVAQLQRELGISDAPPNNNHDGAPSLKRAKPCSSFDKHANAATDQENNGSDDEVVVRKRAKIDDDSCNPKNYNPNATMTKAIKDAILMKPSPVRRLECLVEMYESSCDEAEESLSTVSTDKKPHEEEGKDCAVFLSDAIASTAVEVVDLTLDTDDDEQVVSAVSTGKKKRKKSRRGKPGEPSRKRRNARKAKLAKAGKKLAKQNSELSASTAQERTAGNDTVDVVIASAPLDQTATGKVSKSEKDVDSASLNDGSFVGEAGKLATVAMTAPVAPATVNSVSTALSNDLRKIPLTRTMPLRKAKLDALKSTKERQAKRDAIISKQEKKAAQIAAQRELIVDKSAKKAARKAAHEQLMKEHAVRRAEKAAKKAARKAEYDQMKAKKEAAKQGKLPPIKLGKDTCNAPFPWCTGKEDTTNMPFPWCTGKENKVT